MAERMAAPPDVVQAHRFELVDRDGRVRGVFGELPNPDPSTASIFGLTLYDVGGRRRAYFSLDDMGPNLVFDSGGNNVLQLGVNDDVPDATQVGAYAFAADGSGTPVLGLHVHPDGEVELTDAQSAA